MPPKETPVAGISISISADTKPLDDAIKSAQKQLQQLQDVVVTASLEHLFKGAARTVVPVDLKWTGKWVGGAPQLTVSVGTGQAAQAAVGAAATAAAATQTKTSSKKAGKVTTGAATAAATVAAAVDEDVPGPKTSSRKRSKVTGVPASAAEMPDAQQRQQATVQKTRGIYDVGGPVTAARSGIEAFVPTTGKPTLGRPGISKAEYPITMAFLGSPAHTASEQQRMRRLASLESGADEKFWEGLAGRDPAATAKLREATDKRQRSSFTAASASTKLAGFNEAVEKAIGSNDPEDQAKAVKLGTDIRKKIINITSEKINERATRSAANRAARFEMSDEEQAAALEDIRARSVQRVFSRSARLAGPKGPMPTTPEDVALLAVSSGFSRMGGVRRALSADEQASQTAADASDTRKFNQGRKPGKPKITQINTAAQSEAKHRATQDAETANQIFLQQRKAAIGVLMGSGLKLKQANNVWEAVREIVAGEDADVAYEKYGINDPVLKSAARQEEGRQRGTAGFSGTKAVSPKTGRGRRPGPSQFLGMFDEGLNLQSIMEDASRFGRPSMVGPGGAAVPPPPVVPPSASMPQRRYPKGFTLDGKSIGGRLISPSANLFPKGVRGPTGTALGGRKIPGPAVSSPVAAFAASMPMGQELIENYLDQGKSIPEIADTLGLTIGDVVGFGGSKAKAAAKAQGITSAHHGLTGAAYAASMGPASAAGAGGAPPPPPPSAPPPAGGGGRPPGYRLARGRIAGQGPGGPMFGPPLPPGYVPPTPPPPFAQGRIRPAGVQPRLLQQQIGLAQIGAQISEAQSLTPVRALSVSIGQITSQLTGRAQLQERARVAATQLSQAQRAAGVESTERTALATSLRRERELKRSKVPLEEKEIAELEKLTAAIPGQRKSVEKAASETNRLTAKAAASAKGIVTKTDIAGNIAAGAIGIAGGTLLFGATMQVAQFAVAAFGTQIERVVQQLTGFEMVTGKIQSKLADQVRASGGLVEETVAGELATAAFSESVAESIAPQLEQRAAIIASIKAIQEQNDLLQVGANIGGAGGIDRSVFSATGGDPLAHLELLGGTRSFADVLSQRLNQIPEITTRPRGSGGPVVRTPDPAALQAVLDEFNADLAQVGSEFNVKIDPESADEVAQALKDWADQEGLGPTEARDARFLADALANKDLTVVGPNGEPITDPDMVAQAISDLASVGFKLDPLQFAKSLETPFRRAIEQTTVSGVQEREGLGIQRFLSSIAQPFVPTEQRGAFRAAAGAGAPLLTEAQGQTSTFDEAKKSIDAAHASLKAYADEGEQAALQLVQMADSVSSSNLTEMWLDATGTVKKYGQEIADLQQDMMWKQINYQVAQYNEQIRVANRSLADAKAFIGDISAGEDGALGTLERQNRELARRSTLLAQGMAQRQINFQVAMAGFVAPGTTSEERAARIEQAKLEAAYAQEQLDLQKESFKVSQQIIDVNAIRAVQDLTNQLQLLVQGRALTISLGIDQERLTELQKVVDAALSRAQQVLQEAMNIRAQILEVSTTIATATATTISQGVQTALNAYGITAAYFNSYFQALGQSGGGYSGRVAPGGNSQQGGATKNAAGFLGNVSGATPMIVGEAGTETVAILRNPRQMLGTGGGGGGGGVYITVTGNTFRDQNDMELLANMVAKRVEGIMGQRASQQGFRMAR